MRLKTPFLLFFLCLAAFSHAQEYRWQLGMDYFFDNTEYEKSSFILPQTQNGIWLNPLGGISWDSHHTIYAGVNLLKIPGMKTAIDKVDVTVYYQYQTPKVLFRAGAFPRTEVLSNYSDFFFKDSVNHFMPIMQGVFWQMGNHRNFFNAWMDWTGYATPDSRESFYVGLSGKVSRNVLFADFQSYLFHFAGTHPGNPIYGVSEQLQAMASVGVEYENANTLKLMASAGILAGFERDRKAETEHKPMGFVARANAEYWGIGTQNTLYVGDPRMRFFSTHGGDLYWGTQFLRGSSYLQSRWYVRLLESGRASAQFNCNLHFSEGEIMFQQTLSVSANINNFSTSDKKKITYPWMKLFQ